MVSVLCAHMVRLSKYRLWFGLQKKLGGSLGNSLGHGLKRTS